MSDKRPTNLYPDLRPQKRPRTFPITQHGPELDVSPTGGIGRKLGPQRSSTTPLAYVDSQGGHDRPESGAESPVVSLAEDAAHIDAIEQPSQCRQEAEEENLDAEESSSSHQEYGDDKSDVSSPAKRSLDGGAGPHDHWDTDSSSTQNPKDNFSTAEKLDDYEVDKSVTVSKAPDPDRGVQLGPWSPPPEPLRPENPYKKNLSLTLYRHEACPPFGQDYSVYDDLRDRVLEKDLRQKTLVDLCIEYPPMEGETNFEDSRKLQIVEELHLPRDVTFESDMDYCREVAAYEEMDQWVGGTDVPKFHGSRTFQTPLSLPAGRKLTRDVWMILIERIPGKSMLEFDQNTLPGSERLETLARMSELIPRISFIGVHHHDISQRNIMVCDGAKAGTVGRIALIDFNMSTVERLDDFEDQYGPREPGPDKPPNPLDRWWGGGWSSMVKAKDDSELFDGFPIALQLSGKRFKDEEVLVVAKVLDNAVKGDS
ncbi:hypothetical protein F5883DRAFT_617569 [Diaporthe sp. PMI_573]|nr:hypothetical protein F5883DRAFT_617569 [Diaporthaceae sp. PMI_573]